MRWTLTDVVPLLVDARAVLTHIGILTFVDVCAVTTSLVQMISLITDATEHAKYVLTLAVNTQVTEHVTLINVYTGLFVVRVRMHETHLTVTLEGPWVIEALAILTQGWVLCTLINILTEETISTETSITHTLERSISVDALGIAVTTSIVGETFVHITTYLSVTCKVSIKFAVFTTRKHLTE